MSAIFVMDIFWDRSLKEDDTIWRVYVVFRNIIYLRKRTERDQMIRFISLEEGFTNAEIQPQKQDKFTEVPAIIQYDRQKGIFRRGCDEFSDKIREYPVDVVATPFGLGVNSYCQVYQ
ncbi:hypothetical protein RhiirA4_471791 [Rhizophagus irregularis]|uniref:Uncharacterized protein n=1 Tax=Rhizophagus irregularis TaxID=588596 RepID=A0A2I1H3T3_9GLOM|nr:hypothetical protein RhiirA4_471791 [Rhizophagus irregularis]